MPIRISRCLGLVAAAVLAGGAAMAQEPNPRSDAGDVAPPEGFRANRSSYSAIMDVIRSKRAERRSATRNLARLREMQLEDIWRSLGDYRTNYVRGFQATQPAGGWRAAR